MVTVSIDDCIALVKRELTPKRFEHSLGVMQVIGELAPVYGVDISTAKICGILHDVAKEFSLDRQLDIARKNNILLEREHDTHPLFLHGPVGACYIADELGISDAVILDAIIHHSYFGNGTALSPVLCWCLRFSDILEPSRDWQGIKTQLKPLAYSGHVREAAYSLMQWAISFHKSVSVPVHPNMIRVFQELSVARNDLNPDRIESLPV